jgi:hypothetical protein
MPAASETLAPADAPAMTMESRRWTPFRKALILTIALRIVYSLIAAGFSPSLTLDKAQIAKTSLTEHIMQRGPHHFLYALLGVWERFDTLWYIQIAKQGYDNPNPSVFYPLYPVLIRLLSVVTRSELASAVIITTLSTFFMFWGALRLFELDFSPRIAFRAVVLWALWPDGFVFFAGYPDSLLLSLTVWSLYFARKQRWEIAGATAFLAGLTKALGCFSALPLLYVGWKHRDRRSLGAVLAAVAGTGAYQLWLYLRGFPSPAQVYSTYWFTVTAAPWTTLTEAIHELAKGNDALLMLNFTVLASVTVLMFVRRVPAEYLIFSLAAILLVLTKRTDMVLQSCIRYSLCAVAAYPAMASRLDNNLGFVGIATFLTMLNLFLLRVYLDWGLVV